MPLLNVNIKDADKEKIKNIVEKNKDERSMSDFVRKIIKEKVKINEILRNIPNEKPITIPDYIPKNKFVVFVNGAVVAIGDDPSDLAEEAVKKFPDFPFNIKYNGKEKPKVEFLYMSLKEFHGWKYSNFEDKSYPIIPITFRKGIQNIQLLAMFDSAASLCVLRDDISEIDKDSAVRKEKIYTAGGVIETDIYKGKFIILDVEFETEFILAPISNLLPFKFLIGRNLMDKLDAYFMGKKQVLLLKEAE